MRLEIILSPVIIVVAVSSSVIPLSLGQLEPGTITDLSDLKNLLPELRNVTDTSIENPESISDEHIKYDMVGHDNGLRQ